jgi:hypothetical protein
VCCLLDSETLRSVERVINAREIENHGARGYTVCQYSLLLPTISCHTYLIVYFSQTFFSRRRSPATSNFRWTEKRVSYQVSQTSKRIVAGTKPPTGTIRSQLGILRYGLLLAKSIGLTAAKNRLRIQPVWPLECSARHHYDITYVPYLKNGCFVSFDDRSRMSLV